MKLTDQMSTIERTLLAGAMEKRIPMNGSLELLPLCNMNCDMCYVRLSKDEMNQQGRLRSAKEWLAVGKEMQEAGVMFLLLTGGEVLLHPEFEEIYLGLKKLGMVLTLNTNGTLIDERWVSFFQRHKPRRINITLYGADAKTYGELCHYPEGFECVIHAVKLLKEAGVDVRLGGSLTRANQADIDRILDIGERFEVPVTIDTYMMPAKRERLRAFHEESRLNPESAAAVRIHILRREMGEEIFRNYREQVLAKIERQAGMEESPKNMSCLAGKCSFTVNWQGELRPCVIMTEPAKSVFEDGFVKAWEHVVRECEAIYLNRKCAACHVRPICRTCAASALLEAGAYDRLPGYMCRYAEESYRQLLMFSEESYQKQEKEE